MSSCTQQQTLWQVAAAAAYPLAGSSRSQTHTWTNTCHKVTTQSASFDAEALAKFTAEATQLLMGPGADYEQGKQLSPPHVAQHAWSTRHPM